MMLKYEQARLLFGVKICQTKRTPPPGEVSSSNSYTPNHKLDSDLRLPCQTKCTRLVCQTKRTPTLCQTKRTLPFFSPCVYFFKPQLRKKHK